jgi:hypothetical protein
MYYHMWQEIRVHAIEFFFIAVTDKFNSISLEIQELNLGPQLISAQKKDKINVCFQQFLFHYK